MSEVFKYKGRVDQNYGSRLVKLRETKTLWVSETGEKFRKSTGSRIGNGPFDTTCLILSSVRASQ